MSLASSQTLKSNGFASLVGAALIWALVSGSLGAEANGRSPGTFAGAHCTAFFMVDSGAGSKGLEVPGKMAQRHKSCDRVRIDVVHDLHTGKLGNLGGGAVTLDAQTGQITGSGGVVTLGGPAKVGRLRVRGTPGSVVNIYLPERVELKPRPRRNQPVRGSSIYLEQIEMWPHGIVTIGGNGHTDIHVGGMIPIAANDNGIFTGFIPVEVMLE